MLAEMMKLDTVEINIIQIMPAIINRKLPLLYLPTINALP